MTSLWWPGDHRADGLMSDASLLRALVAVEQAWLDGLVAAGIAPADAARDLTGLVGDGDGEALGVAAEAGGNPVIPLVALLRERADGEARTWLHRGLTSQDVVDSAVMMCARDTVARVRRELAGQVTRLCELAEEHRGTPMLARTLTQPAVPTTFGAKVATWLHGLLDADDDLAAVTFPAQLGGAAGTLGALVELGGRERARAARSAFAPALGLATAAPWHTQRAPVTRLADAAVQAADAWGRIANDVLVLGRPEIGELGGGSGGSSTMPHKANPTTAALVRRAALTAPPLAATLHAAAAAQVDERADGAWHAEWDTLATLLRRTVVAAAQATSLLDGLEVHPDRMATHLESAGDAVTAEQRSMAEVAGRDPAPAYQGLVEDLVDEVLARAEAARHRKGTA